MFRISNDAQRAKTAVTIENFKKQRATIGKEKGRKVDAQKITAELQERDQKDINRSVGPLKKADNAIYIDSTDLSVEQVVDKMLSFITCP